MQEHSVPVLTYAFIGITTLVLTYVTLMDKGDANSISSNQNSATSFLPSPFTSSTPTTTPIAVPIMNSAVTNPLSTQTPSKTVGGKGKHTKHNRNRIGKTKRNRK